MLLFWCPGMQLQNILFCFRAFLVGFIGFSICLKYLYFFQMLVPVGDSFHCRMLYQSPLTQGSELNISSLVLPTLLCISDFFFSGQHYLSNNLSIFFMLLVPFLVQEFLCCCFIFNIEMSISNVFFRSLQKSLASRLSASMGISLRLPFIF